MTRLRCAVLASLSLLGGCHVRGMLSSNVDALPMPAGFDPGCITRALERTPSVSHVQFLPATDPKLPRRMTWNYAFRDRMDDGASLTLGDVQGDVQYSNSASANAILYPWGRLQSPMLDAFRPVMLAVNRQIEADCGLPLAGRVRIRG
jgi:hypothetical protein